MWDAIVDRQQGFVNFSPGTLAAIRETPVAVLGTGGNGVVLDHLVRLGFTRFTLADPDHVEASNLNRLPFTTAQIGMPKVTAWKQYLEAINPECRVSAHHQGISSQNAGWLGDLVDEARLVFAGTTDVEANIVIGRVCARSRRRMIVGPASSGAYVVSTFVHDDGITLEGVAGLGTEDLDLGEIDYAAVAPRFRALTFYPGRASKYAPGVLAAMLAGEISARSCKIFVSLTNAAMAFEAVKNVCELSGLPLANTRVVRMPVFHVFDPYTGCAYYYHVTRREIGIPSWPGGDIAWRPLAPGEMPDINQI